MRQEILKIAIRKFQSLTKKYDKFLIVLIDNWRGYRFIFDTEDVRKCDNNCVNCDLFKLLKSEKENLFSSGLYLASSKAKKIFGSQNFLNCKTLEQYSECYLNFIKKIKNKKELVAELKLISSLKIIYSRDYETRELEEDYKSYIFNLAIEQNDIWKKRIIKSFIRKSGFPFLR